MIALFRLCVALFVSPFKSKSRLEAENVALRHQLIILRRKVRGRIRLTRGDRLFFVQLYRWFPSVLKVITIVRPETLVRWHRAGLRQYWRWRSRSLGGRPQIDADLRALIRRMSVDNPLWGAPRIHGELLKLGFEVAQSSVAKYMVKRRGPLSLPQIKSRYIDDAIHQGRAVVGCVRLCAPHVELARLSPAIGGFEQSCSNSRKTKANAAGAARRTQ